ncbi:glycerate dehydrogenase [Nibricoccus aquaticus]|uniref:Glycerate dehydrogenase n=1 Tax=Nibricoccus aquaticus TaxID=2576891 RepID=A0A290QAY7_9BACT|nr:hydroxyacid dehydrogenase [Nibricoccus aquaticus]ATC65829.1 glycerate dehydrogenase [Nibricoccus aquaticus]
MKKPVALCLMKPSLYADLFDPVDRARLEELLDFVAPATDPAQIPGLGTDLARVEVLIGSWGLPRMTAEFLAQFPVLKILFYTAGSVREKSTPASWARPVRVVTAAAANAVPVAEFTFAQIVLGLKQVWPSVDLGRREQRFVRLPVAAAGTFRSTVALLGLGHIGRLVAERLRTLSLNVIAYDPMVSPEEARGLGFTLCSLEEAFRTADLVSCHLPWLPATNGLIRGHHFEAMKPHAVFLNTARAEVTDESELLAVLRARPDLTALIDVLVNEDPAVRSPLHALTNAFITPHIAGSLGHEWHRLGLTVVDEVERFVAGQPLRHELTADRAVFSA